MLKRTISLIILTALLINMVSINEAKRRKVRQGPKGMGRNYSTTCKEFSKYARFNPYSVLNDIWFVFFYWAAPRPMQVYRFFIPTVNQTRFLHKMFDGKVTIPVNWTARQVLMQDRLNKTWLLVERGDRGQYWSYMFAKVKKVPIKAQDVRLRQHDNGRLLGFMHCESEALFVMSRINEVPLHSKIQDEAARFGFRARRGKSYLYRGHEWMPIPEADENDFFTTIVPEIIKSTRDPVEDDLTKLQISEESTESQKTCKYKTADIYSTPDCKDPAENVNIISKIRSSTEEYMEEKAQLISQSIKVPEKPESVNELQGERSEEETSYNEHRVLQFTKDLKELENIKNIDISLSNKEFMEHQHNNDSDKPSTNLQQELLSTNGHREPQTPIEPKSLQSIDESQQITDKITSNFANLEVVSHTAFLKPVENPPLIEHNFEDLNNDAKINLPIPAPKYLPPNCFEMELVKESIETTPANLPVILDQIQKSIQSETIESRKVLVPFTETKAINLQI